MDNKPSNQPLCNFATRRSPVTLANTGHESWVESGNEKLRKPALNNLSTKTFENYLKINELNNLFNNISASYIMIKDVFFAFSHVIAVESFGS